MTKLTRSLERWRNCNPATIAAGSEAQCRFALEDAKHDIAVLAEALAFYRDGFEYRPRRGPTGLNFSTWKATKALIEDCGETARAALAAQSEESGR